MNADSFSVDSAVENKKGNLTLKPKLGLWSATAISVGATIGAGIFVVIGIAAGLAGSALILSMLLAGVIALFTALSFAELAAWKPIEGSVYSYTRRLVSPYAGFLTGWMWLVSNTFGGATVALGFAYYLSAALPGLPVNIVAAVLCLGFAAINFVGIRQSAWINNILVAVNLAILSFFVVVGFAHLDVGNFQPFTPLSSGMLFGAFFIFFAYGGFARVAVIAEEVKDAKRTVPKAITLSLSISMAMYVLVGVAAIGLVGSQVLAASNSPLSTAIDSAGISFAVSLVSAGGLVATAGVLLTSILGVSRMAFSMSRDRDLPHFLCRIYGRGGTPYAAIWVVGTAMALMVLFVELEHVAAVSTFALLFYYAFANLCAWKLKVGKRLYPKAVALAGFTLCMAFLVVVFFANFEAWLVGAGSLAIGSAIYLIKNRFGHKECEGAE